MKVKHTSTPIDEMLEDESVQVEFDEADRRLLSEKGLGEEFNKHFDRKYKRLLHHGTPDEIAADIKHVVDLLMVEAGHPAAEQKIYVSLTDHTFRLANDCGWKEGPQNSDHTVVGTRGLNWWLGRFEGASATKEYKLMMLLRAALDLEQAATTEDREMAIFTLGKVDERLKLHRKHLPQVRTGQKVKDGGSQGAGITNANNFKTRVRLNQMIQLVNEQGLSVSEAARKLQKLGEGNFEANRKLFNRERRKTHQKSWDIPHDVPNRWFS